MCNTSNIHTYISAAPPCTQEIKPYSLAQCTRLRRSASRQHRLVRSSEAAINVVCGFIIIIIINIMMMIINIVIIIIVLLD